MAVRDNVVFLTLHIPLAVAGLVVQAGVVIGVLVVLSAIFYAAVLLLLGAPLGVVIDALSFSQVFDSMSEEIMVWVAGIVFYIVLLPFFASYNDRLRLLLYDRDTDADR